MRVKKDDIYNGKITIDLTGPQGNAFYILGVANDLCKTLDKSEYDTNKLIEEMKSGDYEHLLDVFEENFGDLVILVE